MKKALIFALVIGLVAGALSMPATAKKKKKKRKKPARIERVIETRYEFPSGIGTSGAGACNGCPAVPSGPGERYAMVEVTDDNLPIGAVELSWDTDGDGINDTGVNICGATESPVEVPESTAITAFPFIVNGPECPGGGATSGTIKITYSNKP
ncbi:MAG: hypothetical protein ACRDLB_03150 [Actinomycetota bacterium]